MPTLPGFPSTGLQALSSALYFLGISVLTHCLSRRLTAEDWSSWGAIREIKWARLCIILIFVDSWLFLVSSGILIFGLGLEMNPYVCATAIYLCVAFYATSKVLLYLFLVEKVHIVWNPQGADSPRFKSKVFIVGLVIVCLYSVVIALMVVGKNHYFREDGSCMIGLKHYASVTLLAYDLWINIFLTTLFLYPLVRTKLNNPRVTRVAIRTLIACTVSLTTSSVNMAVLTILKGHELGWVCLGAGCGLDVIVNACALFWATGGAGSNPTGHQSGGNTGSRAPTIQGKRRRMTIVVPPWASMEEHELSPSSSGRYFAPVVVRNSDPNKNPWDSEPPLSNSPERTFAPPSTPSHSSSRLSMLSRVFGKSQTTFTSTIQRPPSITDTPPVQITVTTHQQTDQDSAALA